MNPEAHVCSSSTKRGRRGRSADVDDVTSSEAGDKSGDPLLEVLLPFWVGFKVVSLLGVLLVLERSKSVEDRNEYDQPSSSSSIYEKLFFLHQ